MVAAMTGSPIRAERLPATLERLPLAEGSVDLVLAHWLMPGPPAVDALLAEVRRVLVPGGLFLWTTLGPGTRTDYAGTSALVDMHDLGSALGRTGFLEPVLDVDRLIDLDTRQSAASTAADMNLPVAICEVIHVAAFAGEAAQRTNADSDGASETLVPLAAIGRRERSARCADPLPPASLREVSSSPAPTPKSARRSCRRRSSPLLAGAGCGSE